MDALAHSANRIQPSISNYAEDVISLETRIDSPTSPPFWKHLEPRIEIRLPGAIGAFRAEFGFVKTATAFDLLVSRRRTNKVGKNTVVFGIYKTRTRVEKAVDNLISAGFPSGGLSWRTARKCASSPARVITCIGS
jgi:hypothetical protein